MSLLTFAVCAIAVMVFIKFCPKSFNSIVFLSSNIGHTLLFCALISLAVYFFKELTVYSVVLAVSVWAISCSLSILLRKVTEKNSYVFAGTIVFWFGALGTLTYIGVLLSMGGYKAYSLLHAAIPEGAPKDQLPYVMTMCLIVFAGVQQDIFLEKQRKQGKCP